jgi:PAS domain S-box-containing protein
MTTLNATQCGARMEVAKQGMLCCKFNSAHKIIGLELMFDVMAFMLQLKQAAGSDTFSVIPNTVQTCQRSFDKPMVMILAEEPYTIVQVNKLWEEMTGYKAEDVVGKTSGRILEGEETDGNSVEVLMNEIRFKRPASAMVLQYEKSGERFRNFFLAYPLSTDSRITHYLIFTTHVGRVVDGGIAVPNNTGVVINERPTAVVPISAQQNFLAQNLQANFNAAKQSAAGLSPSSQQQHPSVPLPQAIPETFSTALPAIMPPSGASANPTFMNQQQQLFTPMNISLKRTHDDISSTTDMESSRKVAKNDNENGSN